MHVAECERPVQKGHLLCEPTYRTLWKRETCAASEKTGSDGEGCMGHRRVQRERFLQDTTGLDSGRCASVKTQRTSVGETEPCQKLWRSGDDDVPAATTPQGVFLSHRVRGEQSRPGPAGGRLISPSPPPPGVRQRMRSHEEGETEQEASPGARGLWGCRACRGSHRPSCTPANGETGFWRTVCDLQHQRGVPSH